MKETSETCELTTSSASLNATSSPVSADGLELCSSQDGHQTDLFGLALPLANPSPSQASLKDTATSDTYGQLCLPSSRSESLQSSLESKLRARLPWAGSMQSLLTWRRKRTPSGRPYSQLVLSVPHTDVTVCGLLPTPAAQSYGSNQGGGMGRVGPVRHSLESMAKHDLWPTPQAHDSSPGNPDRVGRYGTKHGARNLNDEVMLWPTPQAANAIAGADFHRQNRPENAGDDLVTAVVREEMFPTPAERDYRYPNAKSYEERGGGKKGEQLNNHIGGALNPTWVAWLMGFPAEWVSCAPSAMPSSRRSQRSS
jgi:hypothetical protein